MLDFQSTASSAPSIYACVGSFKIRPCISKQEVLSIRLEAPGASSPTTVKLKRSVMKRTRAQEDKRSVMKRTRGQEDKRTRDP